MNKKTVFLFLVFVLSFTAAVRAQEKGLRKSVVKIFTTANPVDYVRPWQSKGNQSMIGSGCIIQGNRILTNAHVVSAQTFIQVKKDNDSRKYTAKVIAVGHDCDLAVLKVDDPAFFKDTVSLEIGDLPHLQDTVYVIGFPTGGDKVSITQGVVSRIEITRYTHSIRNLLAVQIDAAINPGNSGGPVLQDNKLVGIAMQGIQDAQSIGYIIATPVIKHFLQDLSDGTYDGFPMLGVQFADTESRSLRSYYGLKKDGGSLVVNVLPFSPAEGLLRSDDIVLSMDGIPIGEDGTFEFRRSERLFLSHLIADKMIGEKIRIRVLRDGKEQDVDIVLTDFDTLVPYPFSFEENKPPYYVFGGMVFTVLSADLLFHWNSASNAPDNFVYYFMGNGRLNKERRKERVVLLGVLPDAVNIGYHTDRMEVIEKVNGQDFSTFKEFVQALDEKEGAFTVIETDGEYKMILKNEGIDKVNEAILERNNIPSAYSEDVQAWLQPGISK